MKKSFKKTIALLISVLMIASSLPFTAITAEAADWNTIENKIDSKTYPNVHGKFDGYPVVNINA